MHESLSHHSSAPAGSSDRSFGLVFAAFFLIVALLPLLHGGPVRVWALPLAAAFLVIAFVAPRVLAPLNRAWMGLGLVLHRIVGPIALGIVFFGVVMPTGLLMRAFGKDPLRLKFHRSAPSYWMARTPPGPAPESLKNQF